MKEKAVSEVLKRWIKYVESYDKSSGTYRVLLGKTPNIVKFFKLALQKGRELENERWLKIEDKPSTYNRRSRRVLIKDNHFLRVHNRKLRRELAQARKETAQKCKEDIEKYKNEITKLCNDYHELKHKLAQIPQQIFREIEKLDKSKIINQIKEIAGHPQVDQVMIPRKDWQSLKNKFGGGKK